MTVVCCRLMLVGDYLRRGVAEFIGTFALIFVGGGAVIDGDIVAAALANGLVIAVMVSACAPAAPARIATTEAPASRNPFAVLIMFPSQLVRRNRPRKWYSSQNHGG